MSNILVVDDEPSVLAAFGELLGSSGHTVETARKAEIALQLLSAQAFDLVVMDVCLTGMSGLEALSKIQQLHPALPVIVMTAHGTMNTAIEATKLGAFDYHLKPFEPPEMLATIDKALESARLARDHVAFDSDVLEPWSHDVIVGRSPGMQQVFKAIGRVALTDATVLIRGESGTGKELVARAIHQHSRRSTRPLLAVNCAAIPDALLESELFGYERGAFTGAHARKIGKFEQADGGTILLDEIGDVSGSLQAKILRVLQERCFERLGGKETLQVDVRVLAATNRNLEKAMEEGAIREDLFHRLNVVTIQIPSLRERREDIPRLVDYFLARYARELHLDKPPVSSQAQRLLQEYPWQGNVRQLAHCIQRALIFTQGHPIQAGDLALETEAGYADQSVSTDWDKHLHRLIGQYLKTYSGEHALEAFLDEAEKGLIAEALRQTGGNQTHAARLLGIPRATLHGRWQKHQLDKATHRPDS